jgi:CHAT domain-containing protein
MREAEEVLTAALPRLVAAGDNEAIAVQGHLLLAEVLTARGAYGPAAEQIALARAASPSDGRYRFDIAAADHRTRIAAGEATTALLDSIVTTANDMEANGERHSAATERFRAVDVALRTGDVELAARMCDDTARIVRSGPLWLQIQAWTALAAVRMTLGNTRGAAAAVRAGFNRLDEYRRGIGATDLRIHAAEYGERLAAMGLQLAIESGSVGRVYDWAERLRTTASHTAPGATVDQGLQEALSQLRRLSAQVRSASAADSAGLTKELRRQEEAVRALTRRAAGAERTFESASLPSLQAELKDHTLIEYVIVNGNVHAVAATSTGTQLIKLGPSPDTEDLIDQLRAASDRIARPSTSDASRAAALASATETADHIREILIGPLRPLIGRRRTVIIPAGGFHGIPWGHIIDGPVEVAPSATVWLNCRGRRMANGPPVIVSGPDLTHAANEVATIAAIAAAPTHSTAEAVLRGLPDARLAHFACHARARFDSPMFSSLLLDDGEVTLHDIEQLDGAPQTVILAACDSGSAVIASGDEVIGLAGAFLSLGAKTVIAPLFTVSDAATAAMMIRFHEQLATGIDAAAALAELRTSTNPAVAFTARSFVCFGTA